MENDLLKKRHSRFNTPRTAIVDLVRKATATHPIHVQKLIRGYDNEVYLVTTEVGIPWTTSLFGMEHPELSIDALKEGYGNKGVLAVVFTIKLNLYQTPRDKKQSPPQTSLRWAFSLVGHQGFEPRTP